MSLLTQLWRKVLWLSLLLLNLRTEISKKSLGWGWGGAGDRVPNNSPNRWPNLRAEQPEINPSAHQCFCSHFAFANIYKAFLLTLCVFSFMSETQVYNEGCEEVPTEQNAASTCLIIRMCLGLSLFSSVRCLLMFSCLEALLTNVQLFTKAFCFKEGACPWLSAILSNVDWPSFLCDEE